MHVWVHVYTSPVPAYTGCGLAQEAESSMMRQQRGHPVPGLCIASAAAAAVAVAPHARDVRLHTHSLRPTHISTLR
jgi:hypothetical protein